LFVNWQKFVSKSAENRVLRRPDNESIRKEQGFYFEDIIENTKSDGREIVMIIDESHTHLSPLAQEKVINVVDPKIILNVSATPKNIPSIEEIEEGSSAYVSVKREDVITEGLIKEKIAVQTEEDLKKYKSKDLDEVLIDLGISKKEELESDFKTIKKNINPLVIIQLPNDDSKLKDIGQRTKEEVVLDYLRKKGVDIDKHVALWFDGKQKNMDTITYNESDIDFLLFKQAAGTGWDCPRAHILIMFREIQSSTFYVQTVGRILRMPEPQAKEDYKNSPQLRTGFLYTNYLRSEVNENWDSGAMNKPTVYTAKRKEKIHNIEGLFSDYVSRLEYGDLADAIKFQQSFLKSFNDYFKISDSSLLGQTRKALEAKGVNLNPTLTNQIIVDAEFDDFDRLNLDFLKKGHDQDFEMSRNDVEKLFNYYCYNVLSEQTEADAKITNVSRSWSPLKSALRVWFKRTLDENSDYYYRVFISDLNQEQSSIFRRAITKTLKDYRPILTEVLTKRKEQIEKREAALFTILEEYTFTDDYATLKISEGTSNLSVVEPFYLKKQYIGRDNELKFIKFLEQKGKSIEWWFKNGDSGKEYYCLKYFNTARQEDALFYPDWIVRFKDGRIGIFDTKGGTTAQNPEGRAEGIYNKIAALNKAGGNYVGGLVILENNQWYYNSSQKYEYTYGKLNADWKLLNDLF
jgi:type III restriction enzyme